MVAVRYHWTNKTVCSAKYPPDLVPEGSPPAAVVGR
jgi:hypothetical protein